MTEGRTMSGRYLVPGLMLIALGVVFLLNNLGWTDLRLGQILSTWWPAILIVAGVSLLLRGRA